MFNPFIRLTAKHRAKVARQDAVALAYKQAQAALYGVQSNHTNGKAPEALYDAVKAAKHAVLAEGDRV